MYGGLGQSWHVQMEATLIRDQLLMAVPALTRPHTLTEKQAKLQGSGNGWPAHQNVSDTVTNVSRGHSLVSLKAGEVMLERMRDKLPQLLIKTHLCNFLFQKIVTPPQVLTADGEMKLLPCVLTIFPDPIKNHQAWPAILLCPLLVAAAH